MPRTRESRIRQGASKLGVPPEHYRRRVAAGQRWCSGHRAWHPTGPEVFALDRRRPDGLAGNCKAWLRDRHRASRRGSPGAAS